MFEKILKYFSLISLAIFLLSFAYLDGYYRSFNINIVKYASTSEIFYTLLPLVIILLSSGFSIFQGSITNFKNKVVITKPENLKRRWFENHWILISIGVVSLFGLLISSKYFPYRGAPFVQMLCLIILFGSIGYSANREKIKSFGFYPYLKILSFILIGYLFVSYGRDLARVNKALGNDNNIYFKRREQFYKTDKKLIFIGETQSTIFLYYAIDSSTWVVPRTEIDSLIIPGKK